jgi:hypothetical protein
MIDYVLIKNVIGVIAGTYTVYGTLREFYKRQRNKHASRRQDRGTDIKAEIKLRLRHLISRYYFQRIVIIAYSNGTHSYAGESFEYLSVTDEETDGTVPRIIHRYQRYPTSPFAETTKRLRDAPDGWVCLDNENENQVITDIQRDAGIEVSYRFKLGKLMTEGVMVASFTHRETVRTIPVIGIYEMRKIAAEIGALKRSNMKRSHFGYMLSWLRKKFKKTTK